MFGCTVHYTVPTSPTNPHRKDWSSGDLELIDKAGIDSVAKMDLFKHRLKTVTNKFSSLHAPGSLAIFSAHDIFSPHKHGAQKLNSVNAIFNVAALEIMKRNSGYPDSSSVKIWTSVRTLSEKLVWETEVLVEDDNNGLSKAVQDLQVQLLLNYLFNKDCRR